MIQPYMKCCVFTSSDLTWLLKQRKVNTTKQHNTTDVWKNKEDERSERDSVRGYKSTESWNTLPFKNFLHRREFSINLRRRRMLVTGWLQSRVINTSSRARCCCGAGLSPARLGSAQHSKNAAGKADQHGLFWPGTARSASGKTAQMYV